jgi:signal transduction histidine kinase
MKASVERALVDQLAAARTELAKAAGRAEERQRLAHELHDTVAQGWPGW